MFGFLGQLLFAAVVFQNTHSFANMRVSPVKKGKILRLLGLQLLV